MKNDFLLSFDDLQAVNYICTVLNISIPEFYTRCICFTISHFKEFNDEYVKTIK